MEVRVTNLGCPSEFEKRDRNWEIWRRRAVGREKFVDIAKDMGISGGRTRQIYETCERKVQHLIRRNSVSKGVKLRDHLLGVEFAFTHESLLDDYRHEIFKSEYDHSSDGKGFMTIFWVKKPEPSE